MNPFPIGYLSRVVLVGLGLLSMGCQEKSPDVSGKQNDPTSAIAAETKRNLSLWQEKKPKAYRMQLRHPSSGVRAESWYRNELFITVIEDKAASVTTADAKLYHWAPDTFPTVDYVFQKLQEEVKAKESVEVKFDPKFGFPSFVDVGEIEADNGYQFQISNFEVLTLEQAKASLPPKTKMASPDDLYQGLLKFPDTKPKDTIEWLETERGRRNGVVCIWDIKTGNPIFYGSRGDRGNDVEISACSNLLAVFGPATRPEYQLDLFELKTGHLFHRVAWKRPYSELVGGRLSGDGKHYAWLQSSSRIPVKANGFTTNWRTKDCELRIVETQTGKNKLKVRLKNQMQFGADCKFSNKDEILGITFIPSNGASHKLQDKQVAFYKADSGEQIRECAGDLLAVSSDDKLAILRRQVKKAPSYQLIQLDIKSGTEKELRSSPYTCFRFAHFDATNQLLVDVSAHRSSAQLYIEKLKVDSGKSLGEVVLPALNYNEKYSISPDGTVFARLTRNGSPDCRIEIHDLSTGKMIQNLKFHTESPQNKGHVIGDLILLDSKRLATSHPLVIWKD